ncbi:MAG: methyltransferase domain-containing protein [Flavobacterium sp.]|nr:methyltransferase domain-containing protein [Flavobacterium sp.]
MRNGKWTELLVDQNLLQDMGSYWKYLRRDFEAHLSDYLIVFEKYRSTLGIAPSKSADWKALPFGSFADDSSWSWRRQSLEILENHLEKTKPDTVLEIGAWNGWLTKYLAKKSNVVVAADYFVCSFDGIGNLRDLAENIYPIQCDVETIKTDFLLQSFDLIVLNHCLTYTQNPTEYILNLIPLLKEDGVILSLGNTFYKNPKTKIRRNAKANQNYVETYDRQLYIQPVKGYMDWVDLSNLEKNGFQILNYPKMRIQNFISKLHPYKPCYKALLYKKD